MNFARLAEQAQDEITQIIGRAQEADRSLTRKELDRIGDLDQTRVTCLQKAGA
jgi:hypothetical protein